VGQRKSFLRYVGSKNRIVPKIAEHLHATGADCLVDVFGGSGSVIMHAGFRKRVYNDADGDLVNLFRVMANDTLRPKLLHCCRWLPPSREIFNDDHAVYMRGGLSFRLIVDPVERARAMLYRSAFAFGGKIRSGGFQVSIPGRKPIKETQAWAMRLRLFAEVAEFWRHTVIEHLDYQKVISVYGKTRGVVLFFDPPYFLDGHYRGSQHYSVRFSDADHAYLAQQITESPAAAVGTFYEHPKVRELYPESIWKYDCIDATKNSQNLRRSGRTSKQRITELILTKREERG
jgi:site-specific DNA-adenine methylase